MMHNPFQSYQNDPTLAAYAGITNPFSSPFTAMQTSVTNPVTLNPLASALGGTCPLGGMSQLGQTGYAGIPAYGSIHPQQLQLASLLATQTGIPQVFGQSPIWQQQNPYAGVQNPWITGGLQNPLLTAGLQNPILAGLQNPLLTAGLLNPILSQQQFGNPIGSQFGLQPFQSYSPYQQVGQLSPFGQQVSPYGQQVSPYGQQGIPFGLQGSPFTQVGSPFAQHGLPYGQIGSPLAPQSWVGQGPGQIHPLVAQQLAARAFYSQGISPWVGF
jgi:hypothetical protein